MAEELRAVLFGTGGYAANYVEAFKNPQWENVRLAGAVDPYAKDFTFCPLYQDAETMFRETQPHIAIIGTPIQFHAEQAELDLMQLLFCYAGTHNAPDLSSYHYGG